MRVFVMRGCSAGLAGVGLLFSSLAGAAGFGVNEQSASTMGTAYAGRASNAEDASIGSSNPAGIAFLDRQQATVGTAIILKAGHFEGKYDKNATLLPPSAAIHEEGSDDGFLKTTPIPFGHYALPVTDQFYFGLNAYAPFGLNLDYADDFVGRYFGDKTIIQNINLQGTLAYKIQENLSIGVGLIASYITGELTQMSHATAGSIFAGNGQVRGKVTGDDTKFTWNIGVVWQPLEETMVGLSYHAATKFNLEGKTEGHGTATVLGITENVDFKHDAKLDVTMPERVMLSGTQVLNDKWTVMADVTWVRWSQLKDILIVDKEDAGKNQYVLMNWNDVWAFSVGTAYKLTDSWTLKAGYMYEESPTTDKNRTVRAPDEDRHWLTAGAHWEVTNDLAFDLSAAYIMMKDGKVSETKHNPDGSTMTAYGTVTGDYKDQSAWILAGQVTYRF